MFHLLKDLKIFHLLALPYYPYMNTGDLATPGRMHLVWFGRVLYQAIAEIIIY